MYQLEDLKGKANNIRKNIVKTVTEAKSGHPGGSLSSVEILYTDGYHPRQRGINE